MQRTLFDFVCKKTSAPASSVAVGEGGRAAVIAPVHTGASLTSSLEDSLGCPSSAVGSKRARRHSGSSSPVDESGVLDNAVVSEKEDNSCSVVVVDDATNEAVPAPTPRDGAIRAVASSSSSCRRSLVRSSTTAKTCSGEGNEGNANGKVAYSDDDLPRSAALPASHSRWLADLITAPEWKSFLQPITADSWRNGEFTRIARFLDDQKAKGKVVLPPAPLIFNAFNSCPFAELKVVLLGQDPYHNLNQAHGLCFSVLPGVPLPPSLQNMYKELTTDIPGFQAPEHGYLQSWSEQGMLMLNATLTVEAHRANSHSKTSGWPHFTDAVIAHLSQHHPNRLVFLLWGNFAQQKKKLINTNRHVVIESVHPSPLSASKGWFGCHCFSKCNAALRELGHFPMYWQLPLQVQRA